MRRSGGGDTQDVDAPGLDLHDEEDIETSEETVSTCMKSQARSVWACERRKERQVCREARCGAGGRPERRRRRRIVAAATRWPSRRSSPWILTYPQVGFSRARRWMSATVSSGNGGRPDLTAVWRHFQRTRRRCQVSSVPGVTSRWRRKADGRCRARAESTARSAHESFGRLICRRSTATSWRRARISALFAAVERPSNRKQPSSRQKIR